MDSQISGTGSEVDLEKFFKTPDGETGWDRVKMMFDYRNGTPESNFITTAFTMGFLGGGMTGVMHAKAFSKEQFIIRNKDKPFVSFQEYDRKMKDTIIVDMGRIFWRCGWRMGAFAALYTTVVTTIAIYRNKAAIREHILAGCLAGGMWKMRLGLRATLVGTIVGGTLGTLMGTTMAATMWMAGIRMEHIRYWQHDYWQKQLKMREEEKRKELSTSEGSDVP